MNDLTTWLSIHKGWYLYFSHSFQLSSRSHHSNTPINLLHYYDVHMATSSIRILKWKLRRPGTSALEMISRFSRLICKHYLCLGWMPLIRFNEIFELIKKAQGVRTPELDFIVFLALNLFYSTHDSYSLI